MISGLKPGLTMNWEPAAMARSAYSLVSMVPAPTSISGTSATMRRIASSAASVRKVTSAAGRPPFTRARAKGKTDCPHPHQHDQKRRATVPSPSKHIAQNNRKAVQGFRNGNNAQHIGSQSNIPQAGNHAGYDQLAAAEAGPLQKHRNPQCQCPPYHRLLGTEQHNRCHLQRSFPQRHKQRHRNSP